MSTSNPHLVRNPPVLFTQTTTADMPALSQSAANRLSQSTTVLGSDAGSEQA